MTKRDFFVLIIKIFGLFSVITSLFSALPGNMSFAMMDLDAFSIFWIATVILLVIGLFVLLIFKSDKVVTLLKLDKGFDNDMIEFGNIKPTDIIKLGTFIIGGLLILENIPTFLSHSLFAFKGEIMGLEYSTIDKFYWAVSGLNVVIGFLLVTNHTFVANRLSAGKTESE